MACAVTGKLSRVEGYVDPSWLPSVAVAWRASVVCWSAILLSSVAVLVSWIVLGATGFLFRSLPEVTAVERVEMVRSTVFLFAGECKTISRICRQ